MATNKAKRQARKAARKRKREFARARKMFFRALNAGVPISIRMPDTPIPPNPPCALLNPPYKTKPPSRSTSEEVT